MGSKKLAYAEKNLPYRVVERIKSGDLEAHEHTGHLYVRKADNLKHYHNRKYINDDQYVAGDRLWNDAKHGGILNQLKSIDYSRDRISSFRTVNDSMETARDSFRNAIHAQSIGDIGRGILWHVVIAGDSLSDYESAKKIKDGFALIILQDALSCLEKHYRSIKRGE